MLSCWFVRFVFWGSCWYLVCVRGWEFGFGLGRGLLFGNSEISRVFGGIIEMGWKNWRFLRILIYS